MGVQAVAQDKVIAIVSVLESSPSIAPDLTLHLFSVVARNHNIFKELVLEAKQDYEKDTVHSVNIYASDS